MEINENLAKLIFEEFENSIKGTDIYNHEGSMWLIFTEERKWVVEFTNQKTLWYNYKHFTDILVLFGMEVSDGAEYIKKWYEDKFIFNVGKNSERYINESLVDNIIDKGVKQTELSKRDFFPKDVLQNSVKKVDDSIKERLFFVEDTIQNGVKDTMINYADNVVNVEDAIQNGVKDTRPSRRIREIRVEDATQNGVKHMTSGEFISENIIEDTIQNGVKQIKNEASERYQSYHHKWTIDSVIQEGVKEIIDGLYRPVEDTIQNGVKETKTMVADRIPLIKKVFQNGVKEVEYYDGDAEILVNDAIENGVKEVMDGNGQVFLVSEVIRKGVKIVDYHILESMEQKDHSVTTLDFTEKIKDTIENGVKEISSVDCEYPRATENVIKNGVKYMMSGSEFKNKQVEDIIKYSEKL